MRTIPPQGRKQRWRRGPTATRFLVFMILMAAVCFLYNLHQAVRFIRIESQTTATEKEEKEQVVTTSTLRKKDETRPRDKQTKGAFVHVGKTGGSTLSLLLRNGCHSFLPKPCRTVPNETIASKLIERYYHVPDFASLPNHEHSFYIITVRDPYDRIVSAFAYEHPLNQFSQGTTNNHHHSSQSYKDIAGRLAAFRCFPTLEVFVEYIGDNATDFDYPYDSNHVVTRDCQTFARAVMNSHVRAFHHFFFNYGKILSLLPSSNDILIDNGTTIYVTRKEHLWTDWKTINDQLGENERTDVAIIPNDDDGSAARNVTGIQLPVTRDLSSLGRKRLCQALEQEYQNYKLLLQAAQNLSEQDVQTALAYSRRNCPMVVDALLQN